MTSDSHDTNASKPRLGALTLGAIGVVYGDIGTSVLYAVKEVFNSGHVEFTPDNVYGVLSIFVWTLTLVVSLKYVTLVLRADNHGEGGLVAMLALASQSVKDRPKLRSVLLLGQLLMPWIADGVKPPSWRRARRLLIAGRMGILTRKLAKRLSSKVNLCTKRARLLGRCRWTWTTTA